jgi:ankyrin repeat protein
MDDSLHTVVKCCSLWKENSPDWDGHDADTNESNHLTLLMSLINTGADVNAVDGEGHTAEDLAKLNHLKKIESILFIAGLVSRRF